MARWTEQNRVPVDALIDRWRTACLIEDTSLRGSQEVWTQTNVSILAEHFVDNEPDLPEVEEPDKDLFLRKLKEQIGKQDAGASKLMAEMIAIYQSFAVTAIGTDRKREVINYVLAFADDKLEEDGLIWDGMDGGIGGPGQGFNSFRPYLLMYLLAFVAKVKALTVEERTKSLASDADPHAFRVWLDAELPERKRGAQTMRNILLHLLFPDAFERIAVDDDKQQIVARLRQVAEGLSPEEDVDVALGNIRSRLNALLPDGTVDCDGEIDFYYSPLREAWDPEDTKSSSATRSLSRLSALEHKGQVVLYGPPGTGKTYEAKALARQLIRRAAMDRWTPIRYLQNLPALENVIDQQIERRQLHPAYTYEDFIGGLRLKNNSTEPVRGHLLELIDRVNQTVPYGDDLPALPWVLILDEINRADLSRLLGEVFSALDDRDAEIKLSAAGSDDWGPLKLPRDLYIIGTMNLIDQSVEQLDFALRRRFLWLLSDFNADVIAPVIKQRWAAIQEAIREDEQRKHLKRHEWTYLQKDIARLTERAKALNAQITASKLLGPQYRLGHTYFFDIAGFVARDPRLLSSSSQRGHYLWSPGGSARSPLLDLWAFSIAPLLEEYLAGVLPEARQKELAQFRKTFCASTKP